MNEPIEILLVEDNPNDVELTLRAFARQKLCTRFQVARDGAEALDYLFGHGAYAGRDLGQHPKLVLLDLKLPKVDGLEVLRVIKSDPQTQLIPVVILTSSQAEEDIVKSYNLHCNCYVTKPIDLHQFINVIKAIEDFWLTIVKLPPKGAK